MILIGILQIKMIRSITSPPDSNETKKNKINNKINNTYINISFSRSIDIDQQWRTGSSMLALPTIIHIH